MKPLANYISICVILSIQLATGIARAAEPNNSITYLIAVGISDYHCIDDLRLPQNDASDMASLFSKQNAKVYLLLNEKATKSRIIYTMETIFTQAKPNDMILLYFSGHGFAGGFCTYDTDCQGGGFLSYGDLKKIYSRSKAKRKVIFADACFSGSFRAKAQSQKSEQVLNSQNIMLFLSSRTDETSRERSDMKNGYFTHFLLKGLAGEADANKDKVVTSKELFTYVNKNVSEISRNNQHPVMWGKFSDNFIVMKNR